MKTLLLWQEHGSHASSAMKKQANYESAIIKKNLNACIKEVSIHCNAFVFGDDMLLHFEDII